MSEKKNAASKKTRPRRDMMFLLTGILTIVLVTTVAFILIGVLTENFWIASGAAAVMIAAGILILRKRSAKRIESDKMKLSDREASMIVSIAEQTKFQGVT